MTSPARVPQAVEVSTGADIAGPGKGAADTPVISDPGRLYLQLAQTDAIGPVRLRNLIKHFGSPEAVLGASVAELTRVDGIGPATAESIVRTRNGGDTEPIIRRCAELGVRVLCHDDAEFPRPLLHIPDPPICLFVKGCLEPTDAVAVAIVGTRRCSHYGREQAIRFAEGLARAGFTIVSGLARGIDGHAHDGALQVGGRTIAVLGNGLATVYPPEHADLFERIIAGGALLSELPPDFPPEAKNFPPRNRIIIGLALGVIVVEAGQRSGALISARLAADYNREAFAVPGRIDQPDRAAGVNALIREGHAKLVTCIDDVLTGLGDVGRIMQRAAGSSPGNSKSGSTSSGGKAAKSDGSSSAVPSLFDTAATIHADPAPSPNPSAGNTGLSEVDRAVLSALRDDSMGADALCDAVPFDAGQVLASLTSLELRGRIRRLPGNRFQPR